MRSSIKGFVEQTKTFSYQYSRWGGSGGLSEREGYSVANAPGFAWHIGVTILKNTLKSFITQVITASFAYSTHPCIFTLIFLNFFIQKKKK